MKSKSDPDGCDPCGLTRCLSARRLGRQRRHRAGQRAGQIHRRVPNGLAFSEFRGYESWQTVSVSQNGRLIAVILANPVMIDAYKSGVPGNGKPFPDGSKMAKIHWLPKKPRRSPRRRCRGAR